MTSYKLNHFTMPDAQALAGRTADITAWADDELNTKVRYPGARVTGIIALPSPHLVIKTAGAVITDARTGQYLGTRPPATGLHLRSARICEVDGVRDEYRRGDRVALEHTGDPHTRLRPGDEGTVTRYDPGPGQLGVRWDSGSTLAMLLNDGDRVRLLTPPAEAGAGGPGKGAGPASAPSPQPAAPEAALRQASDLGRRHGRAAVYWQAGDSGTARESWQELLYGIASADPAVTGLYEIPDLTGRWDYDRGNLAADLHLAPGDPALDQAAQAYLDAAREEFWMEAARLGRRHLAPDTEDETDDGTEAGDGEAGPDWRQDITDPGTGLSRLLSERCPTCILRDPMTRCTSAPSGPPRSSGRPSTPAPTWYATTR